MKFTTTAAIMAAAMGASAHPSGHAHMHAHRSIEARSNFVMAKKPVIPAPAPVEVASVPETTASKPKPKPKPTTQPDPAAPSSGSSSGAIKPFCDGVTYTKSYSKRATLADISYKGNVGAEGNYGCNLMMVDADIAEDYDHLTTFTNAADEDQECACFLKIGADNGINGFFNGNQALKFSIGAGEKKYLVADDNTQGGCACGPGSVPLTSFGEFAGTWIEFDFNSDINNHWSGADASCLVSVAAGMDIPGMEVCGHDTCSTINPGGTGTNAYLGGMEAEDGVGLNIGPGKVRLAVTVGYSG
jgi:hypothetical protein